MQIAIRAATMNALIARRGCTGWVQTAEGLDQRQLVRWWSMKGRQVDDDRATKKLLARLQAEELPQRTHLRQQLVD